MSYNLRNVNPHSLLPALAILVLQGLCTAAAQAEHLRVATYNIKFFSIRNSPCGRLPVEDVRTQGKRLERLREVIRQLDAQVIGLQEIDDRQALEALFDPKEWTLIIDDDSQDCQDLALAVRHPLKVRGFTPPDFDAEGTNFLAAGESDEFFPRRRDLLGVEVETPEGCRVWVLVHHAKSRSEGRADSDERRAGAAGRIVALLRERLAGRPLVLVGDFNDSPDDRSLNILERGDPQAEMEMEDEPDAFLVNLTEPLFAADQASFGRNSANIAGDRVVVEVPGARQRNFELRKTNMNTGDLLFDQLLASPELAAQYVKGSARIFDHPVAARGNDRDRASDHLPVYADFELAALPGAESVSAAPPGPQARPMAQGAGGLRIAALLPDPEGADEGREQVTLENTSAAAVALKGWKLRDHSGKEYSLSGSIKAGQQWLLTLPAGTLPLNNSGDEVALISPDGQERQRVRYKANQVKSGKPITFNSR
jgi:endonuclease/exonuclease/phosphatase family metal-dependent hydrolase